jgi:hypothetical protein
MTFSGTRIVHLHATMFFRFLRSVHSSRVAACQVKILLPD